MRHTARSTRGLSILAIAAALLLPSRGGVVADDTDLFTTLVPPNVVLLFDNSGSMNNVIWHPAYTPEVVYDSVDCPYVADPDDPDYDPNCLQYPLCDIPFGDAGLGTTWSDNDHTLRIANPVAAATRCGNTREIFVDPQVQAGGNQTRWQLMYLNWYFSDNVEVDHDGDGTTILNEILNEESNRSSCVLAEDPTKSPTYPKYRRSRVTAAKETLHEVICEINQVAEIRYGLSRFYGGIDPAGGYLRVAVGDYTAAHASELEAAIDEIEGEGWTPVTETLYNVYRYFQSRATGMQALGKNGFTRFPKYDIKTDGTTSSYGTNVPPSPVTDDCQKNFVIIITDGEPTMDDFDDMDLARFRDQLIGDYNDPGDEDELPPNEAFAPIVTAGSCGGNASDPNSRSCEMSRYLDDVAAFMQANDFQLDAAFPSQQVIDTYTVGFTTSPAANDLLERTAAAGNGKFFFSNTAEGLTEAIRRAISDIVTKAKTFTAATIPSSRATDGNNFFTSYFIPSDDNPFWQGHLKLFEFNALGEIRDEPVAEGELGECALADPLEPARCRVGPLKLWLDGYWDAANQVPAAAARDLYVSKYQAGPPGSVPAAPPEFADPDDMGGPEIAPADLGVDAAWLADIAKYDLPLPGFDITGIDTLEELTNAIVRYVRGCEFNNGPCVDRGPGQKLWDIFHSNPVVVGPPNAGLREPTYREFVLRYKHRKRVIYAGSNGGFVHGFNAGEYGTTEVPNGYDRGTGQEEFGFMAYPARQNIKELPADTPPREFYFMDGSASAADVWLPTGATGNPGDGTWNDWRTVLIGGMRQGGRAVWALDITNPPDHNSPGGEQASGPGYPGYLWEFPCEASACDAWRPYMGETWSQPVVTRVKVTINCNGETCETYDRWVAIFGAGYDDSGNPNLPHELNVGDLQVGEYDSSAQAGTSLAGRAIFMIDVATGEVLGAKRYQHNGTAGDSSDGEPGMRFALPSTPAVFDLNFDGYADAVYIGDLGGNLWKWVIHEPGQDHINGSEGDEHQARWPFLKILAAENCTSCSPEHYKSFFFPPTGAMVGSSLWLALGSGERTDLDYGKDGGLADAEKNRFYVFKDVDPFEFERDPATLPYTDVSPSTDFVDGTTVTDFNPNSCLQSGNVGFYFQGEDGEKFITNSVIFFGVVFTGSYIPPSSSADPCSATGQAFLYGFDLLCGEGRFPPSSGNAGDPKERRIQVGEGLPNAPRVSVGPTSEGGGGGGGEDDDPCKDMVIVITSEGGGYSEGRCERHGRGLGVKSWRDL